MDKLSKLFSDVNQKFYPLFIARAFFLVNCEERAKDLIQDVNVGLWKKLKKEECSGMSEENLKYLILMYIKWRAIDQYHKSQRKPEQPMGGCEDLNEHPLMYKINEQLVSDFFSIAEVEPPEYQLDKLIEAAGLNPTELLILQKYLEGKKIREIAKELNLDARKITNYKHKMIQKLRRLLTENF